VGRGAAIRRLGRIISPRKRGRFGRVCCRYASMVSGITRRLWTRERGGWRRRGAWRLAPVGTELQVDEGGGLLRPGSRILEERRIQGAEASRGDLALENMSEIELRSKG
jgi:hypothetical protein